MNFAERKKSLQCPFTALDALFICLLPLVLQLKYNRPKMRNLAIPSSHGSKLKLSDDWDLYVVLWGSEQMAVLPSKVISPY